MVAVSVDSSDLRPVPLRTEQSVPADGTPGGKEILALEDCRYEAVLRSDFDAFAALCHDELRR